jgi:hypothetical protein
MRMVFLSGEMCEHNMGFVGGWTISGECEGGIEDMTDSLFDCSINGGFCDLFISAD